MSKGQAQMANEHIVSQVLRNKMGRDARPSNAPRVSSLLQSAACAAGAPVHSPLPSPPKSPTVRPRERTVTFAAAQEANGHLDCGGQGCRESMGGDNRAQRLLPAQLLQQGVESMGGALEVSPSAFGGFTVQEDFVMAMRLSISHAQSMPAEGEPACLYNHVHMPEVCTQHRSANLGPAV